MGDVPLILVAQAGKMMVDVGDQRCQAVPQNLVVLPGMEQVLFIL